MNQDIRQAIKKARIYQYQVAQEMGISENTFIRRLREPLTPEKREQILEAIRKVRDAG